jgi:hypothetical protein
MCRQEIKEIDMDRPKLIIVLCVMAAVTAFFRWADPCQAATSTPSGEQVSQRHDTDAIVQRRLRRVTPEQRAAAAASVRVAREAADPAARNRANAIRTASAYAASVRAQALRDPKNSVSALRAAASIEASARREAARAASAVDAKTLGGSNE